MPVGAEAELALSHFVEAMCGNSQVQDNLNDVDDLEGLRVAVQSVDSSLTGAALIPLEQATSPPKILVDSGEAANSCLLYTSPSPRDRQKSRMPSSA